MEFYRSNKNDRISVFVSTLGRQEKVQMKY